VPPALRPRVGVRVTKDEGDGSVAMNEDSSIPDEDPEFGAQVRRALGWSVANQVILRAASFLSGVLLARLLVPEDFGLFAVALAVMTILVSVNDMGVILGLVRWPGKVEEATPTAFTLAVGSSLVLFAAASAAATPLAGLTGNASAAGLIRVMAISVVIDGVVAVPMGALVRAFRQDVLAKAELGAIPIGIAVTVGLALAGAGPWSLAIGRVAASAATATFFLSASPIKLRFGWHRDVARQLLVFGLPLAGTTLVEELLLNLDYLIVGAILGVEMLGLYLLAFNLANWPISIMKEGIRRVSIAGFARLARDRGRLNTQFNRSVGLLVTGALPMCLGLAILGEPLIRVVYGEKWTLAATALGVLAFLGLARLIVGLLFDLLIALGRSRTTLALQLTWLVVLAPALYLATRWTQTIRGPAVAHVIVAYGLVVPLYLIALHANGIPLLHLARLLVRPMAAGCVAAAIMLLGRQRFDRPLPQLAVGAAGGLVYVALVTPYTELRRWRASRAARGPDTDPSASSEAP